MSEPTDERVRTTRDIYISTLQANPATSAAELRKLLLAAGVKLAKNEPHCTLNQLLRQGRVIATLGTNCRVYSAADPQPEIARRTKRPAPTTAEDAPQSSAQLARVTPVTEDPAQLLRRVLRDHLAEHCAVWFTVNSLADLIDEPARDVALALRDLVQAGDAQVRTESEPLRTNYYAHPSAQRPAAPAAEAPAAESRSAVPPAAIEWLQRDAEDLAGRAVDAGAPAAVVKALITASGAAARAAIALAHTTPAAAGTTTEHAS